MSDSDRATVDTVPDVDGGIDEDIDRDIQDDIAEGIDRDAGYDRRAASEIQTSIAELNESSVEVAREVDDIREAASEQFENMPQIADEVST
jgi:methyl-accepting chemotaxis protein